MIRMAKHHSTNDTTRIRPDDDIPRMRSRSSSSEWSGSGLIRACGSVKTVAASSNEMPCFRRFEAAFRASHSKYGALLSEPIRRDLTPCIGRRSAASPHWRSYQATPEPTRAERGAASGNGERSRRDIRGTSFDRGQSGRCRGARCRDSRRSRWEGRHGCLPTKICHLP